MGREGGVSTGIPAEGKGSVLGQELHRIDRGLQEGVGLSGAGVVNRAVIGEYILQGRHEVEGPLVPVCLRGPSTGPEPFAVAVVGPDQVPPVSDVLQVPELRPLAQSH